MHIQKYLSFFLTTAITLFWFSSNAQQNAQGTSDCKYFSRIPSYFIDFDNLSEFDYFMFWDGNQFVEMEGYLHIIHYQLKEGRKPTAEFDILNQYEQLATQKGGKLMYKGIYPDAAIDDEDAFKSATFILPQKANKQIWMQIVAYNKGKEYELSLMEGHVIDNTPTTDELTSDFEKNGHLVLYINFDSGKSKVQESSMPLIGHVAEILKRFPHWNVVIEGHTDDVGKADRNIILSEERAFAVRRELIKFGIEGTRISAIGYGETKPVANNNTEVGKAQNRRVVLVRK